MATRNGSATARLGFRVANLKDDEADIDIFDIIGDPWMGTMASDFVKELRAITAPKINLHINSPGGYVNDGLAMFNALQQHPAYVTALIESEAASAASFVAMAADKIVIFKNAKMFIHDAQGYGMGNASDMRALADILEGESANIANIYADRSGQTAEHWRKEMLANNGIGKSYRGQEAVDAGLADEVMSPPARNQVPMRPAASMADDIAKAPIVFVDAEGNEHPIEDDEFDLSALKESAVLERPAPTLEALLSAHSLKDAMRAGTSSNGG